MAGFKRKASPLHDAATSTSKHHKTSEERIVIDLTGSPDDDPAHQPPTKKKKTKTTKPSGHMPPLSPTYSKLLKAALADKAIPCVPSPPRGGPFVPWDGSGKSRAVFASWRSGGVAVQQQQQQQQQQMLLLSGQRDAGTEGLEGLQGSMGVFGRAERMAGLSVPDAGASVLVQTKRMGLEVGGGAHGIRAVPQQRVSGLGGVGMPSKRALAHAEDQGEVDDLFARLLAGKLKALADMPLPQEAYFGAVEGVSTGGGGCSGGVKLAKPAVPKKRYVKKIPTSDMGLFGELPGEVRNDIYRMAFAEPEDWEQEDDELMPYEGYSDFDSEASLRWFPVPTTISHETMQPGVPFTCHSSACVHRSTAFSAPGMASTCRQIRREVLDIYCGETFAFRIEPQLIRHRCAAEWIASLGDSAGLIKKLIFQIEFWRDWRHNAASAALTRRDDDDEAANKDDGKIVYPLTLYCPAHNDNVGVFVLETIDNEVSHELVDAAGFFDLLEKMNERLERKEREAGKGLWEGKRMQQEVSRCMRQILKSDELADIVYKCRKGGAVV